MTLSKLESLLLFSVLEIAPASDRWAADCRRAMYGDAATGGTAAGRLRDKEFRRTCLGAVFRRTALGQFPWQARGGAAWFLDICAAAPSEVMALVAYITPPPITLDVSALGLALPGVRVLGPGDKEWRQWLDDCSEAVFVSTASTPLSDAEWGLGEENVVQKAGAARPEAAAIQPPAVQLTMPDAPAAGPRTVLIKPRAAIKKARLVTVAAQGGLF